MPSTAIDPVAEFQYLAGQFRPHFPGLLAEFERLSEQTLGTSECELDLRYGPADRQTFDWFGARGAFRGTLLYFHAGYWHSRDKSGFRFLAPAFNASGLNVAFVNYPLCPDVSLGELVEACRAAPAAIAARAARAAVAARAAPAAAQPAAGPPATPLIVAGHSAGAHIAVELALGAAAASGAGADATAATPLAAVAALSGIYNLAPLLGTTLNQTLRLEPASAAAASPLRRVAAGLAPALFAVGADETPAFIEQTRCMHAAWRSAGNRSRVEIVAGCDHFSLLRELANPSSALHAGIVALAAT